MYSCALFIYKYKNNYLPNTCSTLLSINNRPTSDITYSLRLINEFNIPFARTSIREKSITIRGPKIWFNLDDDIKNSISISSLKINLKKFYVDKY